MPEFRPVSELADMATLNDDEVSFGYRLGLAGTPEPVGSWASRSLWHGWRNGMVDGGHRERDPAQDALAYHWDAATGFADGGYWIN